MNEVYDYEAAEEIEECANFLQAVYETDRMVFVHPESGLLYVSWPGGPVIV